MRGAISFLVKNFKSWVISMENVSELKPHTLVEQNGAVTLEIRLTTLQGLTIQLLHV